MSDLITENPVGRATDVIMAKNCAELLHAHYPGHLWAVDCDGKFLNVRNLFLSGNWGWRVRVDFLYSDGDFTKKIIKAGGELLERYHLSRGKFDADEYASLPTTRAGHLIADH